MRKWNLLGKDYAGKWVKPASRAREAHCLSSASDGELGGGEATMLWYGVTLF
jgi:hypothetical protein